MRPSAEDRDVTMVIISTTVSRTRSTSPSERGDIGHPRARHVSSRDEAASWRLPSETFHGCTQQMYQRNKKDGELPLRRASTAWASSETTLPQAPSAATKSHPTPDLAEISLPSPLRAGRNRWDYTSELALHRFSTTDPSHRVARTSSTEKKREHVRSAPKAT